FALQFLALKGIRPPVPYVQKSARASDLLTRELLSVAGYKNEARNKKETHQRALGQLTTQMVQAFAEAFREFFQLVFWLQQSPHPGRPVFFGPRAFSPRPDSHGSDTS